jgi:hypothetical protein
MGILEGAEEWTGILKGAEREEGDEDEERIGILERDGELVGILEAADGEQSGSLELGGESPQGLSIWHINTSDEDCVVVTCDDPTPASGLAQEASQCPHL